MEWKSPEEKRKEPNIVTGNLSCFSDRLTKDRSKDKGTQEGVCDASFHLIFAAAQPPAALTPLARVASSLAAAIFETTRVLGS